MSEEKPDNIRAQVAGKAPSHTVAPWVWLSIGAALLAVIGNIVALTVSRIYADLTPAFLYQALSQDITSLALITPAWLILAILALRGSLRAHLLWLGVLTFTVYSYVIYTFSIPFGPLFLLWVTVFGMCLYSLIGGITTVDHDTVRARFTNRRAILVLAWSLIVTTVLIGLLWLSEDVPALLSGTRPQSLVDMAITTNAVHILDLGFFLPATLATGVLLIKRRPSAFTFAPPLLVLLVLTGLPILVTPFVQAAHGAEAAWGVVAPIGTLTVVLLALLAWLLSTMQPRPRS